MLIRFNASTCVYALMPRQGGGVGNELFAIDSIACLTVTHES